MADTTLYKQIVLEWGQDTDSLIWGMGCSPDNGEHFYVLNTTFGRKYRTEDGDRIWPFIVDKVKAVLDWSNITNKPDLALKTDLTWSNVTGKPDVALKSDVAAVSAVASNASAKATSNAATIASVSSTANSALSVANSNAKVLPNKLDKADLTWSNITNRPDFDKIASQASQAVVTANTAQSQASAAGQAAASASTQASAAKTTADTATATANAAKASASTASATAASAQQVANSASASASATAVALKNKADTDTVNAQFTAVNSSVANAQSTADNAVAGLDNKLDKTALTWGNIANKPTNLATSENVAKAQSAANSAVSMASGATATANSAKSAATSAAGVANTANTTANSALSKANSAVTVANQANSTANQAVTTANQAKSNASNAVNTANQANTTANTANSNANQANNKITAIQANGGGRNLLVGSDPTLSNSPSLGGVTEVNVDGVKAWHSNNADNIFFDISLDANTTYTYSALIKADDAGELGFLRYGHFQVRNANAHNQADPTHEDVAEKRDYHGINVPANQWTRIYYTFTTNDLSGSQFGVFPSHSDGHVYIRHLMLEKGTVAHDWQPAPEDIQSEIDANKTAAANAQTSANNAQTSANNAQNTADSALSKANSNATALNSKANKSDLTWANISGKPSIPNADDTTTVSSGDLNNYTTTGKYYMPNALSNYTNHPTTGTDMGDWFVMKVDAYHGADMIVQTIYQINSGDVWIRQRWSNSWKSWRQINFWG